ncbi:MAG TPA: hypothetical protein VHE78_11295 [Gemmatimonadaceae bacterium]|nr:hypothetical protein [Gemmatimonadaceae bacterium]
MRRRAAFTLIEIVFAILITVIILGGFMVFGRSSSSTIEATAVRALLLNMRQTLDSRMGEISRVEPTYGDITVASSSMLEFRKRRAISATACGYAGGVLSIDILAEERASVTVGDSLMVRVNAGSLDTTAGRWAVAPITSVTTSTGCNGKTILQASIPAPTPAANEIGAAAQVRIWSNRRYQVTKISTDSGFAMVETINGATPSRVFAYVSDSNVFQYYADLAGTVAASSTPQIRLVRVTMQPYGRDRRERVLLSREQMEFPVGAAGTPMLGGTVITTPGTFTPLARCTTPGATNYGDTRNPCTFPVVCSSPLYEQQVYSCGAGYSGELVYQRDKNPAPDCSWGGWYVASDSCQQIVCSSPTSYSWQTACGAPYSSGTITWQQDKDPAAGCAYGTAYQVANSCVMAVPGCTDPTATNYNPSATVNNGTCTYACTATVTQQTYDCSYIGHPDWTGSVTMQFTNYSPNGCAANTNEMLANTCTAPAPTIYRSCSVWAMDDYSTFQIVYAIGGPGGMYMVTSISGYWQVQTWLYDANTGAWLGIEYGATVPYTTYTATPPYETWTVGGPPPTCP